MNTATPIEVHPLALRKRSDLHTQRMAFGLQAYWHVRDPLSLRNYQLREEENFILTQLDGRTSLEEIQARFHKRFAPRRVSSQQLHWFLGMLHREGLVVSDAVGQGAQLLERRNRLRKFQLLGQLANLLAIRFRGINPDPLLQRLYPICRWLFSSWCIGASLLLIISALCFALARYDALCVKLPTLRAVFDVDNVIWLAVALGGVKVLHELAHALTCRHFGGRCRELGVMLLVFTPCLYCNVSDAWLLPGKWHRIAISAAGIYVELVLAAVCLFLWSYTEPGILNTICLNLVVVCSVSTLLFNGNPLLRYDGYFIMADLLETPNLNEQSLSVVRHGVCRLLGIELEESPLMARRGRWLLALYAWCALAYRCLLVIAILWFCHAVLAQQRLALLGFALALAVAAGMFVPPFIGLFRFLRDPAWSRQMNWTRWTTAACVLFGLTVASVLLRLPCWVSAPVSLRPAAATRVYVSATGSLTDCVASGQRVRPGEVLARLENLALAREITALSGQRNLQQLHVRNLERQQVHDRRISVAGAGGQLPAAREALADVQERLRQKQTKWQRLTIRAPCGGTVLPPRGVDAVQSPHILPGWSGTPLDKQNRGCLLDAGTLLCVIGDPRALEAMLVVEQDDIPYVKRGQRVRLQLDESPGAVLAGEVTEIAELDLDFLPPELTAKRLVRQRPEEGDPRPVVVSYQVRVRVEPIDTQVPIGAAGRGKIIVESRTLASRVYAVLCRTFRIAL